MFHMPPERELTQAQKSRVIVSGTITEIDPDRRSAQGARHQIFSVRIDSIIADDNQTGVAVGEVVNVAIRYGDASSLAAPVPGLAVGQAIALCGAYIVTQLAYAEADGDQAAVIHYTHHPLGWVEYQGKRYQ